MTAREWKSFYEVERGSFEEAAIERWIGEARPLPSAAAMIFPHTQIAATGWMTATVAKTLIESGTDRVLALGVLHGARVIDAERVALAKAGDPEALQQLRKVHGPGIPGDEGIWREEFSLDNFQYFLNLAAKMYGVKAPHVIERYPFFPGPDPTTLPGLVELRELKDEGVAVVATADMIHHGRGYDTPLEDILDDREPETLRAAAGWITDNVATLKQKDYVSFLSGAEKMKSDFRHSGPVLRELLDRFEPTSEALELVDYSDALRAARPTWVAAALMTIS